MAVVLPLLLMVTLGAMKYGWLFLRAQQMTNAARQAARIAALPDSTVAEVQTAISTFLGNAGITTFTVDPPLTTVAGPTVTVGIRVDPNTVDLIPGYLPNPASLYVTVTMAKEGIPAGSIVP
jgi:Flp pilus assembly protein TadG